MKLIMKKEKGVFKLGVVVSRIFSIKLLFSLFLPLFIFSIPGELTELSFSEMVNIEMPLLTDTLTSYYSENLPAEETVEETEPLNETNDDIIMEDEISEEEQLPAELIPEQPEAKEEFPGDGKVTNETKEVNDTIDLPPSNETVIEEPLVNQTPPINDAPENITTGIIDKIALNETLTNQTQPQTELNQTNLNQTEPIKLNAPPQFIFILDQILNLNGSFILNLTEMVSDLDNDRLSYSFLGGENFTVDIFDAQVVFTPEVNFSGTSWFILIADDGLNKTYSNNFTIEVKENKINSTKLILIEEKTIQLPAEINQPVVWKKEIVFFNNNEEEKERVELELFVLNNSFNVSFRDNAGSGNNSEFYLTPLTTGSLTFYYLTEPPKINETETEEEGKWKKEAVISSEEHYENILSYVNITETEKENVHLYFNDNGTKIDITTSPSYNVTYYDTNHNSLIDKLSWITPHLSAQYFEVVVDLTVINVQSYPVVGGEWKVEFNTTGTADLIISGFNGTGFGSDLEWLELKCGNQTLNASVGNNSFNNSILYENYFCAQTGSEVSKVLTEGTHTLEFRFGADVEYAYNNASVNGSNSNLTLWDEVDNGNGNTKYPSDSVTFYARYVNSTSGNAINGSNISCQIKFDILGWNSLSNMTYVSANSRYEYNRTFGTSGTFNWNATCNGSALGYNILSTIDNVTINKSIVTTYTNRTHVINSFTLTATPTIDGNPCTDAACASSTEWNDSLSNARSIVDVDDGLLGDLQVRVKHDNTYLYVFADFIIDTSNQVDDFVNVVIDTANTGGAAPTSNHWRFERSGGSNPTSKAYRGNGTAWVENTSFTIGNSRWNVSHKNGASPVASGNHLTFEYRINMSAIGSSVNSTVGFMVHGYGLPSASGNTYWPAIADKSDDDDYDVPGFNYTTVNGSSTDAVNALPDTWGNLVPNMDVPTTYAQTVTEGNMTIYELHYTPYTAEYIVRVVGAINGTASKTNLSRVVANSDKSLGAVHNKTSQLYVGDNIDLYVKDDQRVLKPFIFLNRFMAVYNKSGVSSNLTAPTASSTECTITDNSSAISSILCTAENNDLRITTRYINRAENTHMIMFFKARNILNSTNITSTKLYNYFDYDLTKPSGSETEDDFYAIIQHVDNTTVSEQVNKEGQVVCDSHGEAYATDLGKCSEAVNDSFFLQQSKGSGEAGGVIFGTEATKFVPNSALSTFIGFTNPSTDTDGKREVPDEIIDVSQTGLMNKADLAGAVQVIGGMLQPDEEILKYFALSTASTEALLISTVNEAVPGVPIDIDEGSPYIVLNGTTTAVTQAGAYTPLNMITEKANTGFLSITVNQTCNITDPNGNVVVQGSYVFNITATEPVVSTYCGGATVSDMFAFNVNNSFIPGVYTQTAYVFVIGDTSKNDLGVNNFTILTDYVGNVTVAVDNNLKNCNETVNITVNVTNIGNTNFTGNLTVDLYYSDPLAYYQNLFNSTINVTKDGVYSTQLLKNITECPFNRSYTIIANFTTSDETNGTENRNATNFYTFPVWSYDYGTVRGNLTLKDGSDNLNYRWLVDNYTGNVFVADADSSISWMQLYPLGIKNDSTTAASSDFTEADTALGITENRDDSIADLFSTDGTTAQNTSSIKVFGRTLTNTSIKTSTNNTNFYTGILWDASDSTNSEFDATDKEDIVFITELNYNKTGAYGTYDYEVRVPSKLNEYKGSTNEVYFYAELK
ncbi:hypothetical protein HZC30_03975 [Candidatus Woesearchaeota archaeon]|nr:hypothetical protein [Candidatus Woesearchaeota archaeon]